MHLIDKLPTAILLGNRGDFGHEVAFDVTAWMALSPDTWKITYMRPGEADVYPVDHETDITVTTADGITALAWKISAAVTYLEGTGSIIVEAYQGAALLRHSNLVPAIIGPGHAVSGDPPEPLASYVDKWSDVDLTLTWLELGADPTYAITQDSLGTHIALGIPAGPAMSVNPETGELEATT